LSFYFAYNLGHFIFGWYYHHHADEFITIPKLITSIKNKMIWGKNMILNWD